MPLGKTSGEEGDVKSQQESERIPETLGEVRASIEALDGELLTLLAKRFALAKRAGEIKRADGLSVVNTDIEDARLRAASARAAQLGLDGHFVGVVMRLVINEARRVQGAGGSSGWNACR